MAQKTPLSESGETTSAQNYYYFIDRQHPIEYRHKEIERLIQAIRARENRLLLGLPGIGMSNLLRFLVTRTELFERDVIFAYLNCDTLAEDKADFETFFEMIAEQLYDQGLGDKSKTVAQGYERLKHLLMRVKGDPSLRIVIVVDQGDRILAAANKAFYRHLKALTDLNKRACYIFAVSPHIADLIDPDNLLFAGRRLAVGPLKEQDCANAVAEEAQRLGQKFDEAIQKRLMRLTGGHPGLLRAISSAIVEEGLNLSEPETVWVERLLGRGDIKYRCQKLWNELDQKKQTALHLLAAARPDPIAADTLVWLQEFGLVDKHGDIYRLFSPIFEGFAAAQDIKLEPIIIVGATKDEQEKIVAGKVFKGDKEVHVTPLELRLIACLKQERKIYTKDDLIEYIYDDKIQEEGISDHRIENLVRQVRNRLGDQYIKAHYGQGYEFLG